MNIKTQKSMGESMLKYTKKVVLMGKKTQICDK
jgi:hypothetical protein